MTVEAWVKPAATSTQFRTLALKERSGGVVYALYASNTAGRPAGVIDQSGTDTTATGTAALAVNTWSHVAVTYDGANLKLFVNGTQVRSIAHTGPISTSTGLLAIGGDPALGQYFNGVIDELRIYNRALTQTQIQTDIAAPVGGVVAPTRVGGTTIADGSAQRSAVRTVTVTFGGVVNLGGGAFTLTRSDGQSIAVTVAAAVVNGQTVATLSFTGTGTEYGSLADGRYTLTVNGGQVTDVLGRSLDGDADGTAGGNDVLSFFRLYGDADGNATVDLADLSAFRSAFNTSSGQSGYLSYLDANNDGTIDLSDLSEFRNRFNIFLP
jgi:hypothetical protein